MDPASIAAVRETHRCAAPATGTPSRGATTAIRVSTEPEPLDRALCAMRERIERLTGQVFNSVLLNLYRDGQDSMSWHSDDEPELGPAPVIASLSLGATRHFRLRRRGQTRTTLSLDLEGGSLLLDGTPLQQHWQHCIPKTRRQTGPRINLTWRQILPHSSSPVSLTRMGQ
ncbi:MAG: alpha-ketoglutarate-dependent dioxygenase AlkB [Gammaproteobacteria bacterium]|nr:alpha-ketoglutarate-dependent dioxygenase AlkB [Gammaproteobacteria bacterium]